jgi:nucleoside-diphosphate-sugar epimerase
LWFHAGVRVLIIGCGYVGRPLGAELARCGHHVVGLRRSASADAELKADGIEPLHADITRESDWAGLPGSFDWIVNCVSSGGGDVEGYRRVYLEGTRQLLRRLASTPPAKFIYTSSTGVYGQNDGSLVDETSATVPESASAQVLVRTERLLLDAFRQDAFPAVILRLAGIYGPDRGHWLQQFLNREARLDGAGGRMINQVHRDDVVGCLVAALERARSGEVYNVVDDEPVSQLRLFEWLAGRLGTVLPPAMSADAARRGRGLTSKRVSNRKWKAEVGYRFIYPTFREGYAAELSRLGKS